jgi:hypothetical protein
MKKPNHLYKLLVAAFTVSSFSEGIILPIYAIFVQKVGGNILDVGYAMGIFLITDGIFTMLIHRFKWTRKQRVGLMVVGWLIWLGGICTYLLISNIWILFLAQFLTAIGNATADPVFDQELAEHTDKELAEYEWGFFEGSKSLLDGVAAIIGAVVAAFLGFTALIYLMIAAATSSFLLILVYIRTSRPEAAVVPNSQDSKFKDKSASIERTTAHSSAGRADPF